MKIVQLIDSLNPGGAERMAVAYANALAERGHTAYLWTSREEGLFTETLSPKVHYTFLNRKGIIGLKALFKARRLIKTENIDILHAHGTSYFFGTLLKILCPKVKLVWHDHYGFSDSLHLRKKKLLPFVSNYFDAIFVVNTKLEKWSRDNLNCNRINYIKNFTSIEKNEAPSSSSIIKNAITDIVCIANLRPQKNHFNLIEGFNYVYELYPQTHLHLVGKNWDDAYFNLVMTKIQESLAAKNIIYHGSQNNIAPLLKKYDLGVLSSDSEGLPISLLEYGLAGLPVVCTDAGYCSEVVNGFGKIVPVGNAAELAKAILFYIENPDKASHDAALFQEHIMKNYTEEAVLPEVIAHYKVITKRLSKQQ